MSSDNEVAFIMTVDIVDLLYAHKVSILTFFFHPRYTVWFTLYPLVQSSASTLYHSL
jgi:hypothetical protein